MGCVEAKPSTNSPSQGLEKLKLENGYVRVRRSTGQRFLSKESDRGFQPEMRNSNAGYGGNRRPSVGERGGQERKTTREGQRESNGSGGGGGGAGNVSQKIALSKPAGEDELVDGWPKWLTDNIPRDVLAGIVPKSADSYEKLDKVGEGTYSNVYKARDKDTGKIVALKKVRFDRSEPRSVKFMAREIMILQKLDHPNIVKLEGLATSRMQYSLYLVFDYMQSDLDRIISRPDERLTEPQVKCYMHQLLSGLQHCHERGILHRDIKGSNLLIDKKGMLKIADFGLANYFNPDKKRPLTSRVVTLWYRAPELLLGATEYGIGIDLWSAGCLMAEMFAGRPFMPGRTEVEQLHRIFKLCGTPSEEYWKRLKVSTTYRPPRMYKPSLQESFRDSPSSSLALLNILLALDPTYRGCAGSALQNEFFHTSPLACDLSGLPVVAYKEDDEPTQTNEMRKRRNSKMKQRSRTQREHRTKDQDAEKPKGSSSSSKEEPEPEPEKSTESTVPSQKPDSSTTSTFSSSKEIWQEESTLPLHSSRVLSSPQMMSPRTEAHPHATKNIKKLPPLHNAKSSTGKYYNGNDNIYRLNQVQRSVSTREIQKLDQRKLYKLHALDD